MTPARFDLLFDSHLRDELFALETPDGVRLTTYDPKLAKQMEVAERIMRKDRQVLRKLAQ